jgi:UDP-glucose 4-epimerase
MTRRAVVTGGAGFIGSHLSDRLALEGWSVLVVDDLSTGHLDNLIEARRRGVDVHQIDIRDPLLVEVMERRSPEVVFHLAAQASVAVSVREPVRDADVNLLGTINVLESARQAGARKMVFASSGGAIYGGEARLPVQEDAPKRPDSPYGISKKIAADYFDWYERTFRLDFTLLALSNVYGPRQDPHGEAGVVSIFSEALLAGRAPMIFGDGEQTRDYVFVEDVADAFVRAADLAGGRLLNIGTGIETSVNQLASRLQAVTGTAIDPVHAPPRPGDVPRSYVDNRSAAAHLGWEPFTDLDSGLAQTVGWMRSR